MTSKALAAQVVPPKQKTCNAEDREGRGCTANDGEACDACAKLDRETMSYWRGEWAAASPEERDPRAYARNMRESGRGHLVRR